MFKVNDIVHIYHNAAQYDYTDYTVITVMTDNRCEVGGLGMESQIVSSNNLLLSVDVRNLNEEEKNFLREGKKISAIKSFRDRAAHRDLTGPWGHAGLADTKDMVEAWIDSNLYKMGDEAKSLVRSMENILYHLKQSSNSLKEQIADMEERIRLAKKGEL